VFLVDVPCSLADTDRRVRGAYCLHRQGDDGGSMDLRRVDVFLQRNIPRYVLVAVKTWNLTESNSHRHTLGRFRKRIVYVLATESRRLIGRRPRSSLQIGLLQILEQLVLSRLLTFNFNCVVLIACQGQPCVFVLISRVFCNNDCNPFYWRCCVYAAKLWLEILLIHFVWWNMKMFLMSLLRVSYNLTRSYSLLRGRSFLIVS
jgi:hypothetical protein